MDILKTIDGFMWDDGNAHKNWLKHAVSRSACEEIFFNEPLIITEDTRHSVQEPRYYALGRTNDDRKLLLVFTIRNNKIRVISARDMNRKERAFYA